MLRMLLLRADENMCPERTLCCMQVRGGLKAIYCSGWQVAGDANSAGDVYPDQSLYPANSVPELVRKLNKVRPTLWRCYLCQLSQLVRKLNSMRPTLQRCCCCMHACCAAGMHCQSAVHACSRG